MRLVAVAIVIVGGFSAAYGAGAFGSGSRPVVVAGAAPPPTPAELRTLERLVLKVAADWGDPQPTDAFVVPTTRRVAEQVDAGDPLAPDTPAYFVVAHGHFTAADVPIPPGAKAPTGTVLTLTVDPQTNESTDDGLEDRTPDLDAIGKPEPLPLSG
jgi:hypothetical protein